MSRKNPPAKWVLPAVIDPAERYCFQISVPKDVHHLAAFRGALLSLASAYNWQDDEAHTAKEVAKVWKNIYFAVKTCDGSRNQLHYSYDEDVDMGIRIDCDCKAWIPCCDGTEKQLATVDMIGAAGQPGAGSIQPGPGQSHCYSGHLFAGALWLVPVPVSTGDVITIASAQGASSQNGIQWFCPDGEIFFAGACGGVPFTDAGDVAPLLRHMQLVCLIDGVYYSAKPGDSITVPGGVSNAQAIIRVNSPSSLAGNSGDISLSVCVQNNQAGSFSHFFDFTTTTSGFVPIYGETWTPGLGWAHGATYPDSVYVGKAVFPARSITKITIHLSVGMSGDRNAAHFILNDTNADNVGAVTIAPTTDQNIPNIWSPAVSATALGVGIEAAIGSTPAYPGYMTGITVEGIGTDPF